MTNEMKYNCVNKLDYEAKNIKFIATSKFSSILIMSKLLQVKEKRVDGWMEEDVQLDKDHAKQ